MKYILSIFFIFPLFSQNFSFEKVNSNSEASFRGLDVISKKIAWVSGTEGTVLKTNDGGRTWEDVSVSISSSIDFRDIEVNMLALSGRIKNLLSKPLPGGFDTPQIRSRMKVVQMHLTEYLTIWICNQKTLALILF